jgi:hypothetical protein
MFFYFYKPKEQKIMKIELEIPDIYEDLYDVKDLKEHLQSELNFYLEKKTGKISSSKGMTDEKAEGLLEKAFSEFEANKEERQKAIDNLFKGI